MTKKIRAFIAVDVGENVRAQMARIQDACRPVLAGVKWVDPALCHVTLNFLGYVRATQLRAIGEVCQQAAAVSAPFELEFRGVGAFPNLKRARVIWMSLGGGKAAALEMQANLTRGLQTIGFKPEDRSFSPHLTLGRFKTPAEHSLEELIRPFTNQPFGRVHVTELRLMRSDLRPSGPIYTVLEAFPLGGIRADSSPE